MKKISTFQSFGIILFSILLLHSCSSTPTETIPEESRTVKMKANPLLYVGTYTKKEGHVDGKADGIYILEMNAKTGALTAIDTIKNTINPSFVTIHPNGQFLYAVNEIAGGGNPYAGTVSSFLLNKDGQLDKPLNIVNAEGDAPCHVSIDPSGKYVLVASYMGTIATFPIQVDGSLGEAIAKIKHTEENPRGGRQEAPHAHMITSGIDDKSVFVVDLGMDKVMHYQLDQGQLQLVTTTDLAAGAGSRHLDFHPTKKWVYVLNELNKTIEAFSYSNTATPFERFQTISTLNQPITVGDVGCSAIHIHPSGQFLYAANRGLGGNENDNIAMYKINSTNGQLSLLGLQSTKGLMPRDFAIDPSGQFLLAANQNSDSIITFKINLETGLLEDTGITQEVKTPVCLQFFKF